MKMKLAGLFTAFLCLAMISGSFAATPQNTGNGNYPTQIIGLHDYKVNMGESTVVSVKLESYAFWQWIGMPWRYIDFNLYNSEGTNVWHDQEITNLFTSKSTATINPLKIGLNPGNYKLVVSYPGSNSYNSCKATSSFDIIA